MLINCPRCGITFHVDNEKDSDPCRNCLRKEVDELKFNLAEHGRLMRIIDGYLHGEDKAAAQPLMCDITTAVRDYVAMHKCPLTGEDEPPETKNFSHG